MAQHKFYDAPTAADPWTTLVATADTANTTVTGVNVTGLQASSLPVGLYTFESLLSVSSAVVTTGVQVGMVWPAQVSGRYRAAVPISSTTEAVAHATASGVYVAATGVGVANAVYLARIDGVFRVTGTLASVFAVSVRSEIAATEVRVRADSFLRYRRID